METILLFVGLSLGIFIGVASVFVFYWTKDWIDRCKEALKVKKEKEQLEKRVGELKPKISKVPDEIVEIYRRKR